MATTPGIQLRVFVGGTHKAFTEPAKWGEYVLGDIGVEGLERTSNVLFVPKIGWRLVDVRTLGYQAHENGKDLPAILTYAPDSTSGATPPGTGDGGVNASPPAGSGGGATTALGIFGVYAGGDPVKTKPNQRWLQELGVAQGSQTVVGDHVAFKHAKIVTHPNAALYPPPHEIDEPVPLDRTWESSDPYDAVDRLHFGFGIKGAGSRTLGPVARFYFASLAGRTKQDGQLSGTGQYALTLQGDGTALLHERRSDQSWAQRASFSWCESSRVIGNWHRITVESDATLDTDGNVYGRNIRLGFSSLASLGSHSQISDLSISASDQRSGKRGILDASYDYRVPNPIRQQASVARTLVRIDLRRDCAVDFQAIRMTFAPTGTLFVKTVSLAVAPQGGVLHVQAFGHFPAGTGATLMLYGAKSGTLCGTTQVLASNTRQLFVDFAVLPGERSYVLNVEMASSPDGLKSPTVSRVRFVREASFQTVVEDEVELTNVTTITTTGAGADPSTKTLGVVCWDLEDGDNAPLRVRSGMRIRVESDLGPNPLDPTGPHLRCVHFRGQVREARRTKRRGRSRQGFGQTGPDLAPVFRTSIKADCEWMLLLKTLAPGRLDFSFSGSPVASGGDAPFKITDIVRDLLLTRLPPERVDVPDLPIPLPLDQDAPTYLEKYQPAFMVAATLVRDYLGGYIDMDDNASPPQGDPRGTTTEGMCRVKFAPKRSAFVPVVEFCRDPIVPGVVVTDPAAYPDARDGTRTYPRTFLRHGSEDEWIEPPSCNQVVVRGLGVPNSALMLGTGGALTVVLNNWVAASFAVEKQPDGSMGPAQGAEGGPPAPDPSSIDYTTGDVVAMEHSDPMLNTEAAVYWIAYRLFDLRCHGKRWVSGEAPIVFVRPSSTNDPLQVNPRTLRYADIGFVSDAEESVSEPYVISEEPSLLCEGKLGGSRNVHGYYALFSAPPTDSYRAGYGDNGS